MTREELLKKWVDALRSGKYKQGAGGLLRPNAEYCCLGVLCDVSGMGQWVEELGHDTRRSYRLPDRTAAVYIAPPGVAELVGFDKSQQEELAYLNDSGNATFEDIANRIEASFPEVFRS